MATINDIARLAGVSHGTVSNVLNKTGKVSLEKVRLVEAAIEKLGYTYNAQAKYLRQGERRMVAVVLPTLQIRGYRELYESMQRCFAPGEYEILVFETEDLTSREERVLAQLTLASVSAIVAVTCLPDAAAQYRMACPKFFINRRPEPMPENARFIGFDFARAGAEIAGCIRAQGWKTAAVLLSPGFRPDEAAVQQGVQAGLKAAGIACELHTLSIRLAVNQAFDFLRESTAVDGLVVMDSVQTDMLLQAARMLRTAPLPAIVSLSAYNAFPAAGYTPYEMNFTLLGTTVGRQLLMLLRGEGEPPAVTQVDRQGIRFQFPYLVKKERRSLSILNLLSPTSAALKKLAPYFEEKTGIELHITAVPHDTLQMQIEMLNPSLYYDLVRMDITWFTEMAGTAYRPMTELLPQLDGIPVERFRGLYPDYMMLGDVPYALPFDPSVLILLYRQDLFEDAVIRRAYYEKEKETLAPPADFAQFNRIAAFFTRALNPDSPVLFGTALASGSSALAVCDFLLRLLAGGASIMHDGRIVIRTPEARAALENYVEAARYAPPYEISWWQQAVKELAEGRCAMVTTFSNHASYMQDTNLSRMAGKISSALVPGNHPLLGGGLLGVSRYSSKVSECCEFLRWYYSEEISSAVVSLGGITPRTEVLDNFDFSLYPWLSTSSANFPAGVRNLTEPAEPGFPLRKFEYLVGSAVRNAVDGVMTPDEALAYAQNILDTLFAQK